MPRRVTLYGANSTGRGCDRYPFRLDIESAGFNVPAFSLMMSLVPGQPWLDSGNLPEGWSHLSDAMVEAIGLPPIYPSIVHLLIP